MFDYQPTAEAKRRYVEQQIESMQVTHYRNCLDMEKVEVLKKQTDVKWRSQYDQKLNEYTLQNGEIETTIDLMNKELDRLGED